MRITLKILELPIPPLTPHNVGVRGKTFGNTKTSFFSHINLQCFYCQINKSYDSRWWRSLLGHLVCHSYSVLELIKSLRQSRELNRCELTSRSTKKSTNPIFQTQSSMFNEYLSKPNFKMKRCVR